jgi:acyl-CoA reductase-like NAD-dependent aldehyde dehydrogenase
MRLPQICKECSVPGKRDPMNGDLLNFRLSRQWLLKTMSPSTRHLPSIWVSHNVETPTRSDSNSFITSCGKCSSKDLCFQLSVGRGFFEAAGLEILPLTLETDHVMNNLKSWMRPTFTKLPALVAPSTSEILYEPLGVVLIIAPFNYPIYLALAPLMGAIAAGNCALLKPSEISTASEKLLTKLIPQYLDNDCFKVMCGGIATTTSILNQRWDKIFFTGSTNVGRVVLQAAVKNMTPVALELGGKSPTVIDSTVTDMTLVAKRVLWGKLVNSGQVFWKISSS